MIASFEPGCVELYVKNIKEAQTDFSSVLKKFGNLIFNCAKTQFKDKLTTFESIVPLFYAYIYDYPVESEMSDMVLNELALQYSPKTIFKYWVQDFLEEKQELNLSFTQSELGSHIKELWNITHLQPNWQTFWKEIPPQFIQNPDQLSIYFKNFIESKSLSNQMMEAMNKKEFIIREEWISKLILDRIQDGYQVAAIFGIAHALNQEDFWKNVFN
ncbi:MAG: hypothetical protein WC860_06200 [Candidatus Margulisiibacteriota bacterium]|jgi:hypothetical protein